MWAVSDQWGNVWNRSHSEKCVPGSKVWNGYHFRKKKWLRNGTQHCAFYRGNGNGTEGKTVLTSVFIPVLPFLHIYGQSVQNSRWHVSWRLPKDKRVEKNRIFLIDIPLTKLSGPCMNQPTCKLTTYYWYLNTDRVFRTPGLEVFQRSFSNKTQSLLKYSQLKVDTHPQLVGADILLLEPIRWLIYVHVYFLLEAVNTGLVWQAT